MNDYNYDYHDLAENADFLEEDDAFFGSEDSNSFSIEENNPDPRIEDEYQDYMREYKDYYHNIIDELDD